MREIVEESGQQKAHFDHISGRIETFVSNTPVKRFEQKGRSIVAVGREQQ
ncbi:hypothetical protein [Natrinema salaciae]|uniref:Uncharacterized protein n=1 Tax=Natrinema salaciae TaxID=1186196 RepID=A0A1H9I5X4_9EURY|nr:hypothetical protein [Natrinema salaciae]SEQ69922.1 hypothetical protein SAMN04489841_2119 [Natrinema salaciae]